MTIFGAYSLSSQIIQALNKFYFLKYLLLVINLVTQRSYPPKMPAPKERCVTRQITIASDIRYRYVNNTTK